jgi:hypothetical protein
MKEELSKKNYDRDKTTTNKQQATGRRRANEDCIR